MSGSGGPTTETPLAAQTLVDLLARARQSEEAVISPATIVQAFNQHDGGPRRKGRYFNLKENRGKALSAPPTNRNEERLAKELKSQETLALPDGDELRVLDYQVPLKAVRSDEIGKIDLVGLTREGQLTLVELKVAESDENPRIALLELLAYWAVIRGNLPSINKELAPIPPHSGPGRLLILAPQDYWDRWREPRRKQRWLKFCLLLNELEAGVDASIECLSLRRDGGSPARFTSAQIATGMEGCYIDADGRITDEGFFGDDI